MHGLSSYFDVSKFLQKELIVISFTVNTIYLSFAKNNKENKEDISVTLMKSFVYQNNQDTLVGDVFQISSSNLMCLLGKVVKFAERDANGSLILRFDNGDILTILDDSKMYESYSVKIGNNPEVYV